MQKLLTKRIQTEEKKSDQKQQTAEQAPVVVGLAGNPNVGKSTIFNYLTGLKQHTGNWPGKTVLNARGTYRYHQTEYQLVDVPGTYTLTASSAEEEVARDFICFGRQAVTVVVVDATSLERGINLVLQTLEITPNVVVCVNLLDEAKKKGIQIDLKKLGKLLAVPVVGASARAGIGMEPLQKAIEAVAKHPLSPHAFVYEEPFGSCIANIQSALVLVSQGAVDQRFLAMKLLEGDLATEQKLAEFLGISLAEQMDFQAVLAQERYWAAQHGLNAQQVTAYFLHAIGKKAEEIFQQTVVFQRQNHNQFDRKLDRILTSKKTGIPIMILLLMGILWLTIVGANYPSQALTTLFGWLGEKLQLFFVWLQAPVWLTGFLVDGVYKTLSWVVAVMLPPMAIFFPLFALLEDFGYLPRVAFNLDNTFRRCCAHGKQALTMCMVMTILSNGRKPPMDGNLGPV